jgi:hypothetical protein
MRISELLSLEFDQEVKKTRVMLERVPDDRPGFSPHPKSMPLGRLAPHIAELGRLGFTVLTEPGLDFSQRSYTPLPLESAAQLVRVFDEGAAGRSRSRARRSSPARASWRIARSS